MAGDATSDRRSETRREEDLRQERATALAVERALIDANVRAKLEEHSDLFQQNGETLKRLEDGQATLDRKLGELLAHNERADAVTKALKDAFRESANKQLTTRTLVLSLVSTMIGVGMFIIALLGLTGHL